jgi:nicotinate-nucleotide adenylyltransferase
MSNAAIARIGIFGGAFDPPHNAHLALARAVIDTWQLSLLHVLPTGQAWHKTFELSAGADRLAMTKLAFSSIASVTVDERELHRSGPTYTIDTLHELAQQYPGTQLVLQIGSDEALFFHRWHRAQEITRIASISIAIRGSDQEQSPLHWDPEDPLPGVQCNRSQVRVLNLPALPHSATEIRHRVALGLPISHLAPPAVAEYIANHHLYLPHT